MKRILMIFSFVSVSLFSFCQIIEPEFAYECGILNNDNTLTICEKSNAKITCKAGASIYLTGIGKIKTRYQVANPNSNVIINKSDTITIICKSMSNTMDPHQVIKVYLLESKKKYRQVKIAEAGTFTGAEIMGDNLPFNATKYGNTNTCYKITLINYPEGEYAISVLNPTVFNCFSIKN